MLKRNDPKPLYEQLEEILRKFIAEKVWCPNQRIPSENVLSKTYGLSRMTVRSVITNLVKEGLLYRVQGKGTFVAPAKISAQPTAYSSFLEQVEQQGYSVQIEIHNNEVITGNYSINSSLSLSVGDAVFYLNRVVSIANEVVCIVKSYVPLRIAGDIASEILNNIHLSLLLREKGYITYSVDETLEARLPTPEESILLKCGGGHPILAISCIHKLEDGSPFMRNDTSFRAERVEIKYNLRGHQNSSSTGLLYNLRSMNHSS